MKRTLCIFLFLVSAAAAGDFSYNRIRYWFHTQGVTNDTGAIVVNARTGIEQGYDPAWGAHPSGDDLTTINEDTATLWVQSLGISAYRVQLWTTLTNAVKKRLALSPPFTQAHADSAKPWVAADMETQRRIKKANDTTSAAYKAAADKLDYDQAIFNSYRALLEFSDFDLTTEHAKQEASP